MTDLSFSDLIDVIDSTKHAYHKLTILVGQARSGKTRTLNHVSARLNFPLVNFGLLFSERLLGETRHQRTLKSQQIATEILDQQISPGVCLDNTESLFDNTLRLNPLVFLQNAARNRLVIASWNGVLSNGELRFGYIGHPDFFSHSVSGHPVVSIDDGKLQLVTT